MPESPQDFHARVVGAVARDGYRDPAWSRWTTWPFDAALVAAALARTAGGVALRPSA